GIELAGDRRVGDLLHTDDDMHGWNTPRRGDGPFWQGSRTPVETASLRFWSAPLRCHGCGSDQNGDLGPPSSVALRDVPTAPPSESATDVDVLVVGAGPAGLAAAIAAHERGLRTVCLDR